MIRRGGPSEVTPTKPCKCVVGLAMLDPPYGTVLMTGPKQTKKDGEP